MQSRFKHYLINHENLPREAEDFAIWWDYYFQLHRSQIITDAEWTFCILAELLEARKPGQWWIKSKPTIQFQAHAKSFDVFASRPPLQKIGVLAPADFFASYSFKKLPGGIGTLLCRWSRSEVNLEVHTSPITPLQMLEMQAQHRRVVTIATDAIVLGHSVDGRRDGLEFLLHDLMHAHHFFSETHLEQVDFFNRLLNGYPDLVPLAEADPIFAKELEYIMSDMNTNISHLRLSLRAALIDRERRNESLAPGDTLSDLGEQRWQQNFVRF